MIDNQFGITSKAEINRPADSEAVGTTGPTDTELEKALANAALKATMMQIVNLLTDSDATEININISVSKTADA